MSGRHRRAESHAMGPRPTGTRALVQQHLGSDRLPGPALQRVLPSNFAKGLCNACGSARAPHGSRVDQASWRAAWAFLMLRCCARRCATVGFSASGMLGLGLA
jgi:hypothetical protein